MIDLNLYSRHGTARLGKARRGEAGRGGARRGEAMELSVLLKTEFKLNK